MKEFTIYRLGRPSKFVKLMASVVGTLNDKEYLGESPGHFLCIQCNVSSVLRFFSKIEVVLKERPVNKCFYEMTDYVALGI